MKRVIGISLALFTLPALSMNAALALDENGFRTGEEVVREALLKAQAEKARRDAEAQAAAEKARATTTDTHTDTKPGGQKETGNASSGVPKGETKNAGNKGGTKDGGTKGGKHRN